MSAEGTSATTAKPSLFAIALTFASISSTAFGGGQKASIRHQVVAKGWMDDDVFMDGLELAQVLPGPNILNLAIYCGQRVRGVAGAIAAFLGASVPPFAIVLVAGALYFKYASNPYVHGALRGCAVGALGLTLGNALELSWDERDDWVKIVLLIATAIVVAAFKMPLLLVMVLFGGAGIVREYLRSRAKEVPR
ncbi:MAG: chromate transporter [Candidatus Eremiobacteraeota bacterium]|nr:chromate transporter [Candidatus Eremiobacteraeota bacterium]MBV8434360.1 chromate transporter [Candidatus Eremiobacteraeota bacterium]